ncbi:MAG: DUF4252 domain-containing protein [Bacteroidetes bacterium]|nr:DUF4252 domain-containing protein [Bacteroidota bacterium]
MKKRFLLLPAFLFACLLHAQTSDALQSFVQKHKNDPAFTFAFISKDLLNVTLKTDVSNEDWKKIQHVVKDIGSLHILASEKVSNGLQLYKEAYNLVDENELSALLAVRDDQTAVRIWAKEESDLLTDIVLLVGAPENFVLILFHGQIDLGDLPSLAALFDATDAKNLAERSAQNKTEFQISPNPSKGSITLKYAAKDDAPVSMSIIDQNGRQVSSIQLSGQSQEQIELGHLNSGTYWVQLVTRQGKVGIQQLQLIR